MTRNICMVLAYDGSGYHGWQTQPGLPTVQEAVEQVACRVVRQPVRLNGSGRTDAGVHAAGQVANFHSTCDIPCTNLQRAIGCRLPQDISLVHVRDVPLGFRASRDALSKLYRYTIHNHRDRPTDPHRQRRSYHFWKTLDVDRMQAAADRMVGEHDMVGFATKGHGRLTTVRTILRFQVVRRFDEIQCDVEGTGFLYNQVRNMVGTLIEVGRGHWAPERVDEIIAAQDRSLAGPTVPACGLCLQWVRYDFNRDYPLVTEHEAGEPFSTESPS